jgi:hypothetical protein
MSNNSAILADIFKAVTSTLTDNQNTLDQADDQNHNHGTNMVKTFQTITSSLEKKQALPASDALEYAAQQVAKKTTSGSGQLYAQGLANAATQLKGQTITPQTGIQLLQTLIGGGQPVQQQTPQSSGGDLLGSLLGGLAGGGQSMQQQQPSQSSGGDLLGSLLGGLAGGGQNEQPPQTTQAGGGDLLGSLLGGLTGGGQSMQQQQTSQSGGGDLLGSLLGGLGGGGSSQSNASGGSGLDMGDLLNAGMAFLQAKQSGNSTMGALLQAVLAGSGMGNTNHRQQSTQLVASSFLQALGTLAGKA